jgi:hypothetical protein
MNTCLKSLLGAACLFTAIPAFAADPSPAKAQPAEKCEHGVKKSLCTRCNPKLKPVFKAKGDWCGEHDRPESQCSSCNPNLAKQGIKP